MDFCQTVERLHKIAIYYFQEKDSLRQIVLKPLEGTHCDVYLIFLLSPLHLESQIEKKTHNEIMICILACKALNCASDENCYQCEIGNK